MADNTQLDLGAGGDLISTDDLGGGVKVQRVKIQYGVDGSATDVSDTNPLPVDDAGGSLTVDSPQLPAALVGGRLDVVVGASLPAGNNNIGDVDVASLPALPAGTNNIGDVDVLSVVPGTGATSLGKAEDAAHVSGDTGVAMLGVRRDTAASGAGTDGDYATLNLDSTGRLYVNPGTDLAVEDAAAAANPTGAPLIARRRDTPLASSEVSAAGDYIALNASNSGEAYTTVSNRSGTNQFTATGSMDIEVAGRGVAFLTIGGAFTATVVFECFVHSGSNASTLRAINRATGAVETGTSAAGEWIIPIHGFAVIRIRVSAYTSGTVFMDCEASVASSANAVYTVAGAPLAMQGPAATDAAVSGNPLLTGARASTAAPSAVSADGDAVPLWANRLGVLEVAMRDESGDSCMDGANNSLRVSIVSGAGSGGTSMTDDAAFTVGTSGVTPAAGYYLAARDTVNDGDAGALAMTERRALYTTLETPGGDSVIDEVNNAVQVRLVATDVASGGFAMTDDGAFTVGTTNVNPVAGVYRSTRDTVDDGDAGALAMTQRRGLLVALETPNGDSLADDTNDHLKVGGALAHDAANAGNVNPLLIGARAANSPLSAVSADGDAAMLRSDRLGQLFVSLADAAGDSCMDGTNDALRVNVVAGAGGGVSHTDDAAFTVGTSPVVPAAGVYRVTRDNVNDGDAGAFAMTEFRAMCVTLEDPNGQEVGTSLRPIRVEVTGSTTQSVAWGDANITDGITALDDECMMPTVNGYGVLNFDVTGTWTATLQFEATLNLSDWFAITVYPLGSASGVTSTAANGRWYAHDLGFQRVRVRASAFTSGTAVVKICGSTSNWVSPVSAGGGTQYQEDAAHASGDTGTLALAVRRDTAAVGSGTDGDYSTLNVNASGRLYTSTTIDAALPAGTNNIGDVDVLTLPALPAGNNNIGDVDVLTLPGVAGTAAHDAAVSGNPLLVAGYAETPDDSAPGNQVSAEGDATRLTLDRDGALYTHPHPPRIWHVATEHTTQQTDASVKAAPGAGLSLYITDITINCNGAVTVTLEEGTTTIKFRYYGSAAGDGTNKQFIVPLKLAANTALTVTTSGAVTCFVGVNGYTAP